MKSRARLSRQHNDANVLSMGERLIPEDLALKIVRIGLRRVSMAAGTKDALRCKRDVIGAESR